MDFFRLTRLFHTRDALVVSVAAWVSGDQAELPPPPLTSFMTLGKSYMYRVYWFVIYRVNEVSLLFLMGSYEGETFL